MCLVVLAWRAVPGLSLSLAHNRDEFRARPAAPAGWWDPDGRILAGRDLKDGGAWLGVTRTGRFALVTNYRDPRLVHEAARSRGGLVAGFLAGAEAPGDYARGIRASDYNPFSLIVGEATGTAWFLNSVERAPRALSPGTYGLSNALLDTPWPKVVRAKQKFVEGVEPFGWLGDGTKAADADLPDTGIPRGLERELSSAYIDLPEYGTRCSTVVTIDLLGKGTFEERTHERMHQGVLSRSFVF